MSTSQRTPALATLHKHSARRLQGLDSHTGEDYLSLRMCHHVVSRYCAIWNYEKLQRLGDGSRTSLSGLARSPQTLPRCPATERPVREILAGCGAAHRVDGVVQHVVASKSTASPSSSSRTSPIVRPPEHAALQRLPPLPPPHCLFLDCS